MPGIGKLEQAAGGTTHIAESAYAVEAAALGTLCNRIYRSGNTTPDLSLLTGAATRAHWSSVVTAYCDILGGPIQASRRRH